MKMSILEAEVYISFILVRGWGEVNERNFKNVLLSTKIILLLKGKKLTLEKKEGGGVRNST